MSTNLSSFSQVVTGLNTFTFVSKTTATHVASIRLSVLPHSGCTIAIQQNGTPIVTATAPANTASTGQSSFVLKCNIAVTAGDTISWVLTSSTASDQTPNSIKGTIDLHVGSNN